MTEQEVYQGVKQKFGEKVLEFQVEETLNPSIVVEKSIVRDVAAYLKADEQLQFDSLMDLAAYDPDGESELGVIYHFYSTTLDHYITLKTFVVRDAGKVPSIAELYRTADWHEREAYDLLGISFDGHPDLKRILMEEDWEGYPLKKDYVPAEFYRGMRIEKVK